MNLLLLCYSQHRHNDLLCKCHSMQTIYSERWKQICIYFAVHLITSIVFYEVFFEKHLPKGQLVFVIPAFNLPHLWLLCREHNEVVYFIPLLWLSGVAADCEFSSSRGWKILLFPYSTWKETTVLLTLCWCLCSSTSRILLKQTNPDLL